MGASRGGVVGGWRRHDVGEGKMEVELVEREDDGAFEKAVEEKMRLYLNAYGPV